MFILTSDGDQNKPYFILFKARIVNINYYLVSQIHSLMYLSAFSFIPGSYLELPNTTSTLEGLDLDIVVF